MKTYVLALLIGIGALTMQTVSAATLTLSSINNDTGAKTKVGDSGDTVGTSTSSFVSVWSVVLSDLGSSGLGDLRLTLNPTTNINAFWNVDPVTGLAAGEYFLTIMGKTTFSITATDTADGNGGGGSSTPIPAAAWLFGSAMLGLLGLSRRQTQTAIAA